MYFFSLLPKKKVEREGVVHFVVSFLSRIESNKPMKSPTREPNPVILSSRETLFDPISIQSVRGYGCSQSAHSLPVFLFLSSSSIQFTTEDVLSTSKESSDKQYNEGDSFSDEDTFHCHSRSSL